MESIIETLYINLDRPQAPDDPELEKAKQEYRKMSDILKAQYGLEFLDRMTALRQRIDGHSRWGEFSFGFCTCARLMLEMLTGQPSI